MPSVFFADNLVGAQILADFAPKDERATFAYQLYCIVARPPVVHQERYTGYRYLVCGDGPPGFALRGLSLISFSHP